MTLNFGDKMSTAKIVVDMKVDLDAVWNTITDYNNYHKFVKGLDKATLLERKGNIAIVEYKVSMLMKTITYKLKHKETPQRKMVWEMLEGDFFKHIFWREY